MATKSAKRDAAKLPGGSAAEHAALPAGADRPTSFAEPVGHGGETHQTAQSLATDTLTSQQGIAIADDQNSLRAGRRGPTLLEDFHLREKIFHFDHERIPERVVHARGYGAHGYFELTDSLKQYTRAGILSETGKRTEVFVRFSTVAGRAGSADLARDVRGFAVKMYTGEGNWDIVGNNIPVFFVQDAIKFPDLIHAVKEEPDRAFPQAQSAHDNFWDFVSLMPEAWHMVMWQMSDRTIPRSFRTMEGFGVHSFRLVDAAGKSTFVKFHWKPKQGLQSVMWDEAVKINGADPDFHRRDLWEGDRARRFSRMGARRPAVRPENRRRPRLRPPRCDQADPRGGRARAHCRPDGARPQCRQFLRRDRAGGVLYRRMSCRASTSPTTRCSRAATSPISIRN